MGEKLWIYFFIRKDETNSYYVQWTAKLLTIYEYCTNSHTNQTHTKNKFIQNKQDNFPSRQIIRKQQIFFNLIKKCSMWKLLNIFYNDRFFWYSINFTPRLYTSLSISVWEINRWCLWVYVQLGVSTQVGFLPENYVYTVAVALSVCPAFLFLLIHFTSFSDPFHSPFHSLILLLHDAVKSLLLFEHYAEM